jgi:hypothetical protein
MAITNGYCSLADLKASAVPAAIRQATVILAMRLFKRLDAPLGMISNDLGSMRVGRFDPDVEALVAPFRKVSAG